MANIIAIIKLAPGEVGYYDELTRIHLTLGRPQANVYDYMNTARLRRSVMAKTLILVAGTLNPTTFALSSEEQNESPVARQMPRGFAIQEEPEKKEELIMAENTQEEVVEEVLEVTQEEIKEEVVEATTKKATSKKKK